MAKRRYLEDRKRVKGTCTYCRKAVAPPKRYWCSDECVHEWKLRRPGSYLRKCVLLRDRGICAICDKDCLKLERELKAIRKDFLAAWFAKGNWELPLERFERLAKLSNLSLPDSEKHLWLLRNKVRSLWDADHITAVEEGGGVCGLENYQTLCLACHKHKTATHAKRRAKRRKRETSPDKRHAPSPRKARTRKVRRNHT